MSKKRIAIKMLLAIMLAASPAAASDKPSYELQEIIISADAIRPALPTDTVNVQVASPGRASTVPELLRQVAGIDVQLRAASGDNQDGTVKLRGFDARRFLVLVDGRPVNMSGVMNGSYMDWNAIPLDTVAKIQIIKGAKSAAYGNTDGGVINIITKSREKAGGDISILSGQNGRYGYLFNYGATDNRLGWDVYANKFGENAFLRNNSFDAEQYGFKLKYDVTAKDTVKFSLSHTEAKRGLIIGNNTGAPGGYDPRYPFIAAANAESFVGGVTANPGAYWQKFTNNWDTTWNHKTANGYVALTFWQNDEKRREVNYTLAGVVNLDRTVVADKSSGWLLAGEEKVGKNTIGYGADYKRYRYGFGWYDVGAGMALYPSQKLDLFGVYVDNTWSLDKRWTGNVGLRFDKMMARPDADPATHSLDANGLSPKLNFSFRNNKDTTTFFSINRLWRAPGMAEFYWWSQNYASGSPMVVGAGRDLKPEKGTGYEVGVEKRVSPRYTTKITVYYQDIQDYINFTHQWPYSCYNIPQAKLWGVEWENTYKLDDTSRLLLNYTNQHTRKYGVNASDHLGLPGELDYRPEHKVTLGYQLDAKPWQVRYNINYTGRQTANYPYGSTSVVTIGGYVIHSLSVVRDLGGDRTLALSWDNIFDKNYVEQYNYPMTGRVFSVTLHQKL
ncbi:MAG TPA: TonB-dependent receptor [Negativicutes bacterium]|nr:TonB-dependent receptor [Negativicutes bacterium]